ncbi:hypothetical protein [Anaeromyxobacter oryzisoli]|uniref:hypothetical protein n=1 Tax=Anaeromyxobacter oryzisoli TaxID=2925408 RepID=UPI001F56344F|nr:hypothetical protein [Anaeromyxobacter sp. SG63]
MAQLIDEGTYRARALEGALGETSTGREQVAVRFALLDFEPRTITWYGYFTDATTESTFRALRTAGWRGQDLSDLSDLSREDAPEVHLVVEHEVDPQGKFPTRARVRWVNSTQGIGLKEQLAPDKAKAFAARMKGALLAFDRANGASSSAPAPSSRAAQARPPARPQPRGAPPRDEMVPQELLERQAGEQGDDIDF